MSLRLRKFVVILFGWFVVSYSGAKIAGPFTFLGDCNEEARHLAKRYSNVSTVCRSFSD